MARVVGAAVVVVIALEVAVPLLCRLVNALIVPAIVVVALYLVVRACRYFTE